MRCPDCGSVEFDIEDVEFVVLEDGAGVESQDRATCKQCGEIYDLTWLQNYSSEAAAVDTI